MLTRAAYTAGVFLAIALVGCASGSVYQRQNLKINPTLMLTYLDVSERSHSGATARGIEAAEGRKFNPNTKDIFVMFVIQNSGGMPVEIPTTGWILRTYEHEYQGAPLKKQFMGSSVDNPLRLAPNEESSRMGVSFYDIPLGGTPKEVEIPSHGRIPITQQ